MIVDVYGFADPDFFAPLSVCADRDPLLRPATAPRGWTSSRAGVWTRWSHPDHTLDDAARPIYVAATIDRMQQVLDAASAVCFERDVAFKHVATETVYRCLNHKNGSRAHAGKLCIAYPPTATAEDLLSSLHSVTAGDEGPVIPGGVRYRDSQVLYYGLAADSSRLILRPDGLQLPASDDTFMDGLIDATDVPRGYELVRPMRGGNAGLAGEARRHSDGAAVFIKQALRHGSLSDDGRTGSDRLRDEWRMLRQVHDAAPELCPRPLEYIEEPTHEYLVSELVTGRSLAAWTILNSPLPNSSAQARDWARYYQRVQHLISQIEENLERLRLLGYHPEGITPRDVLIGPGDKVRLTGFTYDPDPVFQPGPPRADAATASVSKIAFMLLSPLDAVVERTAAVLPHIHRDLAERGPVPPALWRQATRFASAGGEQSLPGPGDVDSSEDLALADLRDRVAAGIIADAGADEWWRAFPTVPQGYESNTIGVAYGLAGVVHSLLRSGTDIPEQITRRLRDDALSRTQELAPGLYVGLAGIAWVLADLGLTDEATTLLAAAGRHPLTRESATLAWGGAGVAMAHLGLYGHTRDGRHIERAKELMTLPESTAIAGSLGPNDATGLWYGRTGVAHAYQQLAAVTGDRDLRLKGLRLLHAELDRAKPATREEIMFPASAADRRGMYYLYCGSAGFLRTACRYLAEEPDERLASALPKLIRKSAMTYVAHAGLCQGLTGLGFALAECGDALGDATARAAAWKSARGLFKHAIPDGGKVRFLGDLRMRYSCDLWSGSSGILLFLSYLLSPRPDALFTVDALAWSESREMALDSPRSPRSAQSR